MNAHSFPKAVAILGATASGKTRLALQLAKFFPCEIISLDSALVYRGMDIGTAKPHADELRQVPHHLIDIIDPLQSYSAANFVADCCRLVAEIEARGRMALIVGGTMMYFQALLFGLNDLPQADQQMRQRLQAEKERHGLAHLYQQLQAVDGVSAQRISPHDSQRIERALEVFHLTGMPLSQHFARQQAHVPALDLFTIMLVPSERAFLHQQIAVRFAQMLRMGFVDEVRNLRARYPQLTVDFPSMRCVGYRQVWAFLENEIDEAQLLEQGIVATRQLAKRQLTWLRKLPFDRVLDPFGDWDQLVQTVVADCVDFMQKKR